MEEERLKKRLLQLPENNPTVSPWHTIFNGPAGLISEYHSKNLETGESWFYVGPFNQRANFHDLINSREDHRVQAESNYAFVDFRAPFDSVDREALWQILELTGLPGNIADFSRCCTMRRRAVYK
ncbi:hypothetical protein QYM36_012555 [Artemia franciscana]|uniref:Uncharacterized protein n=1 Tax=Artemia franciscana TaxID=6661 RepID=A0AA88HHI6_ARTSF|nr:hypothetical protein QYM36_012555 [Artemia franciscana]